MGTLFFFLLSGFFVRADDVGDISADASAIYTGNTYHGYAEMRVDLQNRSHDRSHVVTLVYPNSSYGYGNNISRLSRTVTLPPESLQTVSLLLPPLPSQGDSSIHVVLDDGHEGDIHAPNANDHCNEYGRSQSFTTVFISRSLDDNAVEHLFHANQTGFTAAMAVGPPDASGMGMQPMAWTPDTRRYGETNWLELDYAKPQMVDTIVLYETQSTRHHGTITMIGASGTNLEVIPMTSGSTTSSGSGWISKFHFTATTQPVKTLRLNFGKTVPYSISVDAVQISGPTDSQWASDARASSDNSAQASAYSGGMGSPDPVESMRAESPVTEWSETWLAYSPFDCIVLGAGDLSSMSPGVFNAIEDYIHAGGNVILFGATDLPSAWHPWSSNKLDGGTEYKIGFGRCFTFATEDPAALDRRSSETLRATARNSAAYWSSLPDDNNAASALPVHGNLSVPVRGIVLTMLAFVVIIGPANLIYLHRRKRQIWMLWTIPAISCVTTLFVFTYSLLREGVTPDIRISGLTILDQISHRAATIGGEAFYCPLTPSSGLHFDYETEATPLVSMGYGPGGTSRGVDWSQSQHFQHGWVSARVPAYFHVRKSETSRERIEVSNENGTLRVLNGLGAPIKTVWVTDANMNLYEANDVAAGQKASLVLAHASRSLDQSGPDDLERDVGFAAGSPDDFGERAQAYLKPNTYIAILDGNPFIENALTSSPNAKHTKTMGMVFGILDSTVVQ